MKRVNLSLTEKCYNLLKKEAEKRGESISSINREAVENFFNKNKITNEEIMEVLKDFKMPTVDEIMGFIKQYEEYIS